MSVQINIEKHYYLQYSLLFLSVLCQDFMSKCMIQPDLSLDCFSKLQTKLNSQKQREKDTQTEHEFTSRHRL